MFCGECGNIKGFACLVLPARVPGMEEKMTHKAKGASIEVVRFKGLLPLFLNQYILTLPIKTHRLMPLNIHPKRNNLLQ
jgi:hypothetical protein